MSTFLFHETVFGPIISRRLGVSLGVNLLPTDGKVCSFDCIYCECGYNVDGKTRSKLPTRETVKELLEAKFEMLKKDNIVPDVITFAGNGEPTMHPQFKEIIDDTLQLRDAYFPQAKVSVLSNATRILKPDVFEALNRVDNNILKLDSVFPKTVELLNAPNSSQFNIKEIIEGLKKFQGNLIIQTLFVRGFHNGERVDNTTEEELKGWLRVIEEIAPSEVMIYVIDRETPEKNLEKIPAQEMEAIANRVRAMGITVHVSA